MAAIDFPASPTVGQIFTPANGVTYRWNGTLWLAVGASTGGDFCAQASGAFGGTTPVTPLGTVINGNSGSYYNPANGRWTPPSGRYCVYGYWSHGATGSTRLGLWLRKNGTAITPPSYATTAAANYNGEVNFTLNVDANGSDWFDMQCESANVAGTAVSIIFGAFPISGIQGPPGAPPTAGGGIIREVTLAAPTNTINLFSLGVKSVDVMWSLIPDTASTTGRLRFATGSTVNSASTYFTIRHYNNDSTAGADTLSNQVGFRIIGGNSANAAMIGRATFPSLVGGAGISQWWHNTPTQTILMNAGLVGPVGGGDGLSFSVDTGNFATGSFVRVIGWP